ncbi:hypothetical protein BH23PLA1_BH23PLA1_20030 [soil metagenome]
MLGLPYSCLIHNPLVSRRSQCSLKLSERNSLVRNDIPLCRVARLDHQVEIGGNLARLERARAHLPTTVRIRADRTKLTIV